MHRRSDWNGPRKVIWKKLRGHTAFYNHLNWSLCLGIESTPHNFGCCYIIVQFQIQFFTFYEMELLNWLSFPFFKGGAPEVIWCMSIIILDNNQLLLIAKFDQNFLLMMHNAPTSSFKRTRKKNKYTWPSSFFWDCSSYSTLWTINVTYCFLTVWTELVLLKWEFIQDWQQVFICGNTF